MMRFSDIVKISWGLADDYAPLGRMLNSVGRILGDPNRTDDLTEMHEKYSQILGKLDRHGCNFVLILASMVNNSLEELKERQDKQDDTGVN